MTMWIIAYVKGEDNAYGWCVVDLETRDVLSGPYPAHKDAKRAAETRAMRIGRGWAP
jgi:hypothetical protein